MKLIIDLNSPVSNSAPGMVSGSSDQVLVLHTDP